MTPVELKEIVYQAVPYVGMAKVFDFLHAANDVAHRTGVAAAAARPVDNHPGHPTRERARGAEADHRRRAGRRLYDAAPDDEQHIQRYLSGNCFGDYLTRGGIDIPTRELLTFAMLASLGGCDARSDTSPATSTSATTAPCCSSVLTQLLPFIGYPRTLNALRAIDETTHARPARRTGS